MGPWLPTVLTALRVVHHDGPVPADPRRGNKVAHPNEDLVREGYAAFGRGDIEALQSQFFAPDIRWHFPGRSPFAGDYTGVAEVLGWLGRSAEVSGGTLRVELHDVIGTTIMWSAWLTSGPSGRARSWTTTRSRSSMSGTEK